MVSDWLVISQSDIKKPFKVLHKGEADLHWDIRAIFVTTRKNPTYLIRQPMGGLGSVSTPQELRPV